MASVLIKPKEITVTDLDGEEHDFKIHRLPATIGREVAYQYMQANMPALGNYEKSAELFQKLMAHVTKKIGGDWVPLDSPDLIDNHTVDWQMGSQLEDAMIRYNTDFLPDGKASIFSAICQAAVKAYLTPITTDSSGDSSEQD